MKLLSAPSARNTGFTTSPDLTISLNDFYVYSKYISMKKLWPLILTIVMVIASCDKYSEGEYCPIGLDTVYADPNSIVMTVFVNESYLQLNYCELGAVCSTSKTPPSGDVGISAIKTPLARKGLYQLEFSGSFPEARYYVHLYTSSHESGKARYHDCIEVVMDGTTSDTDGFRNLSATGTANCYIVSSAGRYKFRPTMGNSDEIPDIHSVEVLWETFGTDETPEIGALIPYAEYADFDQDTYFDIYFNATDRKGNAVIAAKDSQRNIVWSWHIWLTDKPVECVYANNAGTMMDRNLGATSATPGDVGALGLLYQWGRKDPFLGSSSISSDVVAQSTISWPEAVGSNASNGTISYATEHPTSFITGNSSNRDWYYTGGSNTDNTRWQSIKTINDPCPAGWRVPDGGSDGVWAKAGFPSGTVIYSFNSSDSGMTFGAGICSPATWYPAAGYRCEDNGGDIRYTGSHGNYWSVSPYGGDMVGISALYFDQGGTVFTSHYSPSASGLSVRCMKDDLGEGSSEPEESVSWILHSWDSFPMIKEGDLFVAREVVMPTSDDLYYNKFQIHNSLGISYGGQEEFHIITPGEVLQLTEGYNSIYIDGGVYDIWFHPGNLTVEVVRLDDKYTVFDESANCYIVSESGTYKFRSVQGNSGTSVGDVAYAEVLWESFGTDVTPKVGDLIKSVSYKDGEIAFQTADSFKEGNAVIAAKDASGTILWSWHIWLTDQPVECVYANNAGTMMDRNLGATSATPGDVGALGLLYQWGRKDPFLGSSSISESILAKSTGTWPAAVESDYSQGTEYYSIKYPTTFISYNKENYDWYYTGSSLVDNTRWQSLKTVYDPCPFGWRVPDGGESGVWTKADFQAQTNENNGKLFTSVSFSPTWYPATGYRSPGGGGLSNCRMGRYWSVTPSNSYEAYQFYFDTYGTSVLPSSLCYRGYGNSVRCIKE